jgi:hypothetical protein
VADRPADIVSLDAFRARRAEALIPPPAAHHHLAAGPGLVTIVFAGGLEVELSPIRARVWAERLAAMADVADQLQRDADWLVRGPEGGDRG